MKEKLYFFLDLWFGLSGTVEALDRLAQEFFDVSSSNDEKNQKSLLEKARELVQGLTDKKDQKRLKYFNRFFFYINLILYLIIVVNRI